MMIRQETKEDFDPVYALVAAAFKNETHSDGDEQNLVNRLRKSTAFIPALSLVAEEDGVILGYALLTKITIGSNPALALAPVAVLPTHKERGIGSALIKQAHTIGSALGFGACVVLGHPSYYPRFGYERASTFGITCPFPVPDDSFMAIPLMPHGLKNISGVVSYAKEFFEG